MGWPAPEARFAKHFGKEDNPSSTLLAVQQGWLTAVDGVGR